MHRPQPLRVVTMAKAVLGWSIIPNICDHNGGSVLEDKVSVVTLIYLLIPKGPSPRYPKALSEASAQRPILHGSPGGLEL